MGRWVAVLVSPFVLIFGGGLLFGMLVASGAVSPEALEGTSEWQAGVIGVLIVVGVYALIAVIGVGYYAAYYRKVIATTTLGELEFEFTARSKDWLKLFLGNIGLAIVTLGIGIIFWSYRNWAFFVRHLEAYGNVDPTELTQSTVAATGDAEGLAGMFEIGAI